MGCAHVQLNLYVAKQFPRWKQIVLDLLAEHFDETSSTVSDKVMRVIKDHDELNSFNKGKQVAQFAAMVKEDAKTNGARAFALEMVFDETRLLEENVPYICAILNISAAHVFDGVDQAAPQPEVLEKAVPGKPQPHFFYSADLNKTVGPAAAAASLPSKDSPAISARPATAPAASPTAGTHTADMAAAAGGGEASRYKMSKMEYLAQHDLATELNKLVNDVATEQPNDPFAALAAKLFDVSSARGTTSSSTSTT